MTRDLFAACPAGGVFHTPETTWPALRTAASQHQMLALQADCRHAAKLSAVLTSLGRELAFPDWYGANLDALADYLGDADWLNGPALLTLQLDAGFARRHAGELASLIEVFAGSIEERAAAGRPLWIAVNQPHPDLAPLPHA